MIEFPVLNGARIAYLAELDGAVRTQLGVAAGTQIECIHLARRGESGDWVARVSVASQQLLGIGERPDDALADLADRWSTCEARERLGFVDDAWGPLRGLEPLAQWKQDGHR